MQIIVDILKSLVSPLKMMKYRYMSVLIAILIFLGAANLMSLPYGQYLNKSVLRYRDDYVLLALLEIPENETNNQIVTEIKNLECKVSEDVLKCENLNDGDVVEKKFTYTQDGITKNVHFIIDYYIEEVPNFNINTGFTLEDYPYVSNEENYFILLTPKYLYYQAHPTGIDEENIVHNDIEIKSLVIPVYFSILKTFDITTMESTDGFSDYIVDQLLIGFASIEKSRGNLFTIVIIFLYPIFPIFLFWLLFKRSGRLKSFKEYYNVGAIASVVPILLTFIISWFYPNILTFYIYYYSAYFLFCLYRINNSPEL